MKRLLSFIVLCCISVGAFGQISYGTTGLMNMPTADMNEDKTFMAGGNWLNHHGSVPRWWYDTWNYYVNITFVPFLEIGYLCTGHKSVPTDYGNRSGYWVPYTYGRFVNQDRSFHFKLRLWKEGWWKDWTPQIVIGVNDLISESWKGGSLSYPSESTYGNGFWNRYFVAITKHIEFDGIGILGIHASWIYCIRYDNNLNNPAFGANFKFTLPDNGTFWNKALNGLNLMAEVTPGYTDVNEDLTFDTDGPRYQVNIGAQYSFMDERINLVAMLHRCRYLSVGMYFKIGL